jgi:hypothetical protein
LLVAEVGDEFEGSAERGDEAVEDVLGGHVPYLLRERRQSRRVTGKKHRPAHGDCDYCEAGNYSDTEQRIFSLAKMINPLASTADVITPRQRKSPGQRHDLGRQQRVRRQGLEPRTRGLRVRCSAN